MYIKVEWIHEFPDEPVIIYSELDDYNNEIRKIEVYKDGKYGYANNVTEFGGTMLSKEPLPTIEEIDSDKQFRSKEITKNEFEDIWCKIVKSM